MNKRSLDSNRIVEGNQDKGSRATKFRSTQNQLAEQRCMQDQVGSKAPALAEAEWTPAQI